MGSVIGATYKERMKSFRGVVLGSVLLPLLVHCGDDTSGQDGGLADAALSDAMLADGTSADGAIRDSGVRDGASVDASTDAMTDAGPWIPAPSVGTPTLPPEGRGEPPVVLWPRPVHAHPEVPLAFTFVAYDPEHETLLYSLDGAPAGMHIDASGTLHWASPLPGRHDFTVSISDGRADAVEAPISINVDAEHFLFVSPDGSNAGDGSLDAPLADLEEAQRRLAALGWGTLYIRGGTYPVAWNWEVSGRISPLRGAHGSADAPFVVRGYPGESVVVDCEERGHGFWSFAASYVLFADFEVRRPAAAERAGMNLGGDHSIAQNVTVRDANWPAPTNCTGFLLRGDGATCHRCRAYGNYDRDSEHWNSSNYLIYLDRDGPDILVLDSLSEDSVSGFKIKHAGAGTALFHGNLSRDRSYGFGGVDDGSEVRFNTLEGASVGASFAITDPNAHTHGDFSFHHNTIRESAQGMRLGGGYLDDEPSAVHHNVVATGRPLGSREDDPHMLFLWPWEDSPPALPLTFSANCYGAPDLSAGFRFGRDSRSFDEWQAAGYDSGSVGEVRYSGESFSLVEGSACAMLEAGAWGTQR